MELSDYERRVLTELEHELERRSPRQQLRTVLVAWWRRATLWVLMGALSIQAVLLCVLAGIVCEPDVAATLIGLVSLGLGLMWGLAVRRRPAG